MIDTFIVDIPHMGTIFTIPEVLLVNYANTFIKIDTRGYKKTKEHIETNKMIKKKTITSRNDKYDAHDRIFKYLGLNHAYYDEKESVEYWLQKAIKEWWQAQETQGLKLKSATVMAIPKRGFNGRPYYTSKVETIPPRNKPNSTKDYNDETHTKKMSENI